MRKIIPKLRLNLNPNLYNTLIADSNLYIGFIVNKIKQLIQNIQIFRYQTFMLEYIVIMKFKVLIILFFVLLFFSIFSKKALAHFDETDGDATVTLHIDPNDKPTAEKKASLYFLIEDFQKGFKLSSCDCVLRIYENNNQIFSYKLTDKNNISSVWGVEVPFIFPKNDIYHISLKGIPSKNNLFRQFSVSWDFKVDPITPGLISNRPSDKLIIIIVSLAVILFSVLGVIFFKREIIDEENKQNKNSTDS